jgi:hypothetical protein
MSDDFPPYFETIYGQYLYRVYVTSVDLIFVELGTRVVWDQINSGLGGAAAAREKQREYQREIEHEAAVLAKRNADGIRIFAKANKRGFVAGQDDLEEIRVDAIHQWKRFFFMSPNPAFIIQHVSLGKRVYEFRAKKDVIIAIHELQRLFGDDLEIGLPSEYFQKALKKYRKMQG